MHGTSLKNELGNKVPFSKGANGPIYTYKRVAGPRAFGKATPSPIKVRALRGPELAPGTLRGATGRPELAGDSGSVFQNELESKVTFSKGTNGPIYTYNRVARPKALGQATPSPIKVRGPPGTRKS